MIEIVFTSWRAQRYVFYECRNLTRSQFLHFENIQLQLSNRKSRFNHICLKNKNMYVLKKIFHVKLRLWKLKRCRTTLLILDTLKHVFVEEMNFSKHILNIILLKVCSQQFRKFAFLPFCRHQRKKWSLMDCLRDTIFSAKGRSPTNSKITLTQVSTSLSTQRCRVWIKFLLRSYP